MVILVLGFKGAAGGETGAPKPSAWARPPAGESSWLQGPCAEDVPVLGPPPSMHTPAEKYGESFQKRVQGGLVHKCAALS